MKIGVLGTGDVGTTLATKFIELGHEVKLGSRTANNKVVTDWKVANGNMASAGTFAEAASYGDIVFNCTAGMHSLEALNAAGADNLRGKILVDVANPLDFSHGMPPALAVCNTDSLGEQIQRAFPETKVVKTLNTLSCKIMVNPDLVPGDHTLFISGDDADAKQKVTKMLKEQLRWKSVIDLGGIKTARGTEMLVPAWIMMYGKFQHPNFNFNIVMSSK